MSYVGNKPAQTTIPVDDSVTTAMLQDDAVTADKVANAINTSIAANTSKVTNATHSGDVTGATALTIAAGAVDVAMLSATGSASSSTVLYGDGTWKAEPTTDTTPLLNDIATLALHSAVQSNQAAYNLTNAFIDQYEDDTGIDNETNTDRNSGGEWMGSIVPDTDTILYLNMDGADGGTTFTDTSYKEHGISVGGTAHTDTTVKKWGTASLQLDGNSDYIFVTNSANITDSNDYFNFGTRDYTIECWVRSDSSGTNEQYILSKTFASGSQTSPFWIQVTRSNASSGYNAQMPAGVAAEWIQTATSDWVADTWYHMAAAREGTTTSYWFDGTRAGTVTNSNGINANADPYFSIGAGHSTTNTSYYHTGYIDDVRVSSVARYSGATITVPTGPLGAGNVNATGSYTSTTETALATVSKMSIVVLYKNEAGTATLDTDLVAEVSSNGGTNYTSAPLTAAGTFSTGILMAKSNDITISNTGTAPKYKISFANQVEDSKETQVHGVALLY